MLSNLTARPDKVHSKATTAANHIPATATAVSTRAPDPSAVPFALAADRRLSPTDRLVACALTWWAWGDRPTAEMSNRAIAAYVGVSVPTVERSMKALAAVGLVRTEAVRPTAANMTGRVVTLRWVEDPSVLPGPPARTARGREPRAARGPITDEAPSPLMDPAHQAGGGGSIADEAPPPSPAMDKESSRLEAQDPKNARVDGLGRQRPQADGAARGPIETAPPTEAPTPTRSLAIGTSLTGAVDRAVLDARQLAAMTTNPTARDPGGQRPVRKGVASLASPRDPSRPDRGRSSDSAAVQSVDAFAATGLTDGQRAALEAMAPDRRQAFEAKSPGVRAQVLAPFTGGFDPGLFERVTRALLAVPRFVARAHPPDRSKPSLVAGVAAGDPRLVSELAEAQCRNLGGAGDRRRWGALYKLAEQLLRREVDPDTVLDALRQALGPKSRNRGAVFTTALERAGWGPRSSRRSLT